MVNSDQWATQRDLDVAIATELHEVGFDHVREIGRGGFGIVYRCLQRDLDRAVAVKVLIADIDEAARERFAREQRAMGRLTGHPNIVSIFQAGVIRGGRPYLVMPYYSLGSLDSRIRRDGPTGWDEAFQLGVKVAGALETAHRLGILHRDVKPANILLAEYGEPQLTDFGIAHVAGAFETTTGAVRGSPAFTAPEVLKGSAPTPASDVYSLGAALFCAITGHAAFERLNGEQVVAQFLRITTEPVPELRDWGVPGDVSSAIEHSMAGDPGDRPATAAEFGEELRQAQGHNDCPVCSMVITSEHDEPPRYREQHRDHAPGGTPSPARAPSPGTQPASPQLTDRANEGSIRRRDRRVSGNLPLELTSFVGRRHEIAMARKLMTASRLVTLTGIGGVGKTRLALRVAADAHRAFADGVWLVELGEFRDEAMVAHAIAATLGIVNQPRRNALALLTEYLSMRRLLLVLDSCEHLVDTVATLAETLLRACPKLQILVTSRESLGVGGEGTFRVPPLSLPKPSEEPSVRSLLRYEAVTLFADRAAKSAPEYVLTQENMHVATEICQRLDGLPLLIELAAVRLRAMSATQILDRLNDRYRLLSVGTRGAPTRQQTLRSCIDWSYELCTDTEKRLWAELSVFAGGFELDAAEAVCGEVLDAGAILDGIASLVDKSILIREEPGAVVRYRLLESLSLYGRDKLLEINAYIKLQTKHRDWCQELVLKARTDWISPRQIGWITRLQRELPNFRNAMEFCLSDPEEITAGLQIATALQPFWLSQGLFAEGRHWIDRALTAYGDGPAVERAAALSAEGILAGSQGDLESGRSLVDEADQLAARLGSDKLNALVSLTRATLALCGDDPGPARAKLKEAIEVFRNEGETLGQIHSMVVLAYISGLVGDTATAMDVHKEVLAITEAHGESRYRSYSLNALGIAFYRRGNLTQASALLEQSLRLCRALGEQITSATCIEAIAWIAADEHRARHAALLTGSADSLFKKIGSPGITVVMPNLRVHHDECRRVARRALGSSKFESALRAGSRLNYEEAVALALGQELPVAESPLAGGVTSLTRREWQVACLVGEGLTNKAIAAKLVISPRTAQGHVEHILSKLRFTSRAQIAAWVADEKKD
ncbi:MAG: protein kinase [Pseudonocardia sp.]|nr:MAG: protein kinase [Pseudonocardia sp.]